MTSMTDRAHDRVKALSWEPTYVQAPTKYPTKYKLPTRTKTPSSTSSGSTAPWKRRRTTGSTAR